MKSGPPKQQPPPRKAEAFLQRWIPQGSFGEALLGDLSEEFQEQLQAGTRWRASLWYWRQTVRLGLLYLLRRLRRPVQHSPNRPRGNHRMSSFFQDFWHGVRLMARTPRSSIVALLTLALAIGASTAVFSIVQHVLLRPFPFPEAEQVVQLVEVRDGDPVFGGSLAYPDFEDYLTANRSLQDVSAYHPGVATLLGQGEPQRLTTARVSGSFFEILGVQPRIGRFFLPSEGELGHDPVAVVSHSFWQSALGADPQAVGQTLNLNGLEHLIVGVTGESFEDPLGNPQLYIPRPDYFDASRQSRFGYLVWALGRIRPGISLSEAQADLDRISQQLIQQFPGKKGMGVELKRVEDLVLDPVRRPLAILMGGVLLILIAASANVAGLWLSRTASRLREFAVRSALGAGRLRLAQQLLAEGLAVALAGGLAGLGLAWLAIEAFLDWGGGNLPRIGALSVNLTALGFAIAACLTATLLSVFAPALWAARSGSPTLRNARSTPGSRGHSVLRGALVTAEFAVSMLLLAGAALLLQSFWNLSRVNSGIQPEDVLTFAVTSDDDVYDTPEKLDALYGQIESRLAAIPAVESVGAVNQIPMNDQGGTPCFSFRRQDRPPPQPGEWECAQARTVTPGYFRSMGIRLLRGRLPQASDARGAGNVLVINETLARQAFAGEDPLGKRLILQQTPQQVIGIVNDVRLFGPARAVPPAVYSHHVQEPASWMRGIMIFALRCSSGWRDVAPLARQAVWAVDENLPVTSLRPMSQVLENSLLRPRWNAALVGSFATLAVLLACGGIFALMGQSVSSRSNEMGVRMALGAGRRDLIRMVQREGLRFSLLGVLIGLAGALLLSRLLQGMLFGISPIDPATLALVPALLVAVSWISCLLPARKAGRLDPAIALRHD